MDDFAGWSHSVGHDGGRDLEDTMDYTLRDVIALLAFRDAHGWWPLPVPCIAQRDATWPAR